MPAVSPDDLDALLAQPGRVWRDGDLVKATRRAVLPPHCINCGAAAEGEQIVAVSHWHDPLIYLLLLVPILYIVVALIVRKRSVTAVGVCKRHRRARNMAFTTSLLVILAGVINILNGEVARATPESPMPFQFHGGLFLVVGGILLLKFQVPLIRARRATRDFVWFKASPEFRDSLVEDQF